MKPNKAKLLAAIILFFGVLISTSIVQIAQAQLLRPNRPGGLLAPLDLSNIAPILASPAVVGGSSSSTITGDGSTSTIGSVLNVIGALAVGGTSTRNQATLWAAATSSVGAFTLGPLGSVTSSATTSVSVPVAGLSVGDPCKGGLTTATATTAFGIDVNITAATSTNATATVTFWNGASVDTSFATGTARIKCEHLAI